MFDPGQGLPMFSGKELLAFVEHASYLAVNDYEGTRVMQKSLVAGDRPYGPGGADRQEPPTLARRS